VDAGGPAAVARAPGDGGTETGTSATPTPEAGTADGGKR
jgi:hypothetical protein